MKRKKKKKMKILIIKRKRKRKKKIITIKKILIKEKCMNSFLKQYVNHVIYPLKKKLEFS